MREPGAVDNVQDIRAEEIAFLMNLTILEEESANLQYAMGRQRGKTASI